MVGSSFTAHPSRAVGSIWRTDAGFQTTISIENTTKDADVVKLTLFSESGTYEKTFPIAAGNLLKINLRELQQNSVPDDSGRKLTASFGTLSISGAHGVNSALTFDKLIHSANTAGNDADGESRYDKGAAGKSLCYRRRNLDPNRTNLRLSRLSLFQDRCEVPTGRGQPCERK